MGRKPKGEKPAKKPITPASPETIEFFESYLGRDISIAYTNNPNLKQNQGVPFKVRITPPEMLPHVSYEVFVVINEDVFDALDYETQKYIAERLKSAFYYDSEKEKVVLQKPDFNEHLSLAANLGTERCEAYLLAIRTAYEKESDQD